jgi:hypothetical protein
VGGGGEESGRRWPSMDVMVRGHGRSWSVVMVGHGPCMHRPKASSKIDDPDVSR